MGALYYLYLKSIFATKLTSDVSDFLETVLNALESFFEEGGSFNTIITIFMGIAGSLLIVFLAIDILDKASKDMFTLEKLIVSFIRFFLAFVIIIYLPNLLPATFGVAKGMFEVVETASETPEMESITFFAKSPEADSGWLGIPNDKNERNYAVGKEKAPDRKKNTYSFVNVLAGDYFSYNKKSCVFKGGTSGILDHMSVLLFASVGVITGFVSYIAAYFAVLSTMLQLMVRSFFAPIAVVQCFDEGQRSSGIRYLKKFFSLALTFSIILGILFLTQKATGALMISQLKSSGLIEQLPDKTWNISVANMRMFAERPSLGAMIMVMRFAVVGLIMGASRISDEIMGVH